MSALPWTAASTMAGLVVLRRTASLATAILLIFVPLDHPAIARPAAQITPPPERILSVDPSASVIAEAARRFGIPAMWIRAVMHAESGGDVRAASPKGAMGLMQIMPKTWTELRLRHHLGVDPYDPPDNIMAGAAYLREMYDRYGPPGFLAAYNAGPARYEEHLSTGRALPAETRAYVATLAPMIEAMQIDGPIVIADSARASLPWTRSSLFVTREAAVSIRPSESNATADRSSPDMQRDARRYSIQLSMFRRSSRTWRDCLCIVQARSGYSEESRGPAYAIVERRGEDQIQQGAGSNDRSTAG
ncbi:hypothetical protein MPC1_290003 [Methylocella tundrae]|nr:hypothetical protein MPC1_290003 [Methylocella tundrae]